MEAKEENLTRRQKGYKISFQRQTILATDLLNDTKVSTALAVPRRTLYNWVAWFIN